MPINFPNNPDDGDIFQGYIYDSTKSVWKKLSEESSLGLTNLSDVGISSPENGQALIYDTSIEEWTNQTLVEPILTLEGLSDTTIEDPLDGQALVYDSASGQWINETQSINLNDLNDTTITTPATGEALVYNGTDWVNQDAFAPKFLLETSVKTTTHTLSLDDINKVIPMNGSNLTVVVPSNAEVAFPIGTVIAIYNLASTNVIVAFDGAVTIRNVRNIPQFAEISLRKRGTNEWVLVGG